MSLIPEKNRFSFNNGSDTCMQLKYFYSLDDLSKIIRTEYSPLRG